MKRTLFLLLCLFLGACTTAYGPQSFTGGYKERKVSDNAHVVSFFGNGNTSEQQVWNYWIYRCAELTNANGYAFFELTPSAEHAGITDDKEGLVRFEMLPVPGEETSQGFKPVYYYYTTVTTYSSKALVKMFNQPIPDDAGVLLDAKVVMDMLSPYVKAKARVKPPERKDLFVRAAVEAALKTNRINKEDAGELEKRLMPLI
jgi:hypothetical protein